MELIIAEAPPTSEVAEDGAKMNTDTGTADDENNGDDSGDIPRPSTPDMPPPSWVDPKRVSEQHSELHLDELTKSLAAEHKAPIVMDEDAFVTVIQSFSPPFEGDFVIPVVVDANTSSVYLNSPLCPKSVNLREAMQVSAVRK